MRLFDFNFSRSDAYALLPWIIAFMMLLTVLCACFALNINSIMQNWKHTQLNMVTLHMPIETTEDEKQLTQMEKKLKELAGVMRINQLGEEDIRELLAPWLGSEPNSKLLPIPILLEVQLDKDIMTADTLRTWLNKEFPTVEMDDQEVWLHDFRQLITSAGWVATGMVLLIGAITSVIVVMSTRTELLLHRKTVYLLKELGAENHYITRQFNIKALWTSLQGALIGSAGGLIVLALFANLAESLDAPFLPLTQLSGSHIWMVVILVSAILALTGFAAHITVRRALKQPFFG